MKLQEKSGNIQNFVKSAGKSGSIPAEIAGKRKKHAEIEEYHSRRDGNVVSLFS
jgi:hypothetical protein